MTKDNTIDLAPPSTDELPKGTELMSGQYTITGYLNHGGFGITYLATDSLDRQVVVKECFPDTMCRRVGQDVHARSQSHAKELQAVIKLFLKEARALSKLNHPNIVGVHQVFEEHGTAYMILDYVKGSDLLSYIEQRGRALMPTEIGRILRKTLDAVGFVHEAGLLHRDISPDNIILTDDHEPILIDFGAAREQATKTTQALSALRVVKDGYSPQEFYLAGSAQGPSSDLYSVAATFYHIIAGSLPPDSQVRLTAHVGKASDPYVSLSKVVDGYDGNFCAAIDKALAVLPKDRFQTAAEWSEALDSKASGLRAKAVVSAQRMSKIHSRRTTRKTRVTSRQQSKLQKQSSGLSVGRIAAGVAVCALVAGGAFVALSPSPEASTPMINAAAKPAAEIDQTAAVVETAAVQPVIEAVAALPVPVVEQASVTPPTVQTTWADGWITLSTQAELPFALDDEGVLLPADAERLALPIGSRLQAVGGIPVTGRDTAQNAIQTHLDGTDQATARVAFDWAVEGEEVTVRTLADVPVSYETSFENGLRFAVHPANGAWVTSVVDVPQSGVTGLAVGDEVIGLMSENIRLSDITSLAEVTSNAISNARSELDLAIRRNGTLWNVNVNLTATDAAG
ncbi:serine/threonine protein kinase [Marivita sp. S0852]|uniref:serine/threonine protein kinase n=1 Tax=Marivita sp. S0852 TaxID=3373893 RepID=UPI003982440F